MEEGKIKVLFPDDIETITISKNDYDRLYGEMTLENIELKEENEKLHTIIKEVRKEIEEADDDITLNLSVNYMHKAFKKDLLEILDKENSNG